MWPPLSLQASWMVPVPSDFVFAPQLMPLPSYPTTSYQGQPPAIGIKHSMDRRDGPRGGQGGGDQSTGTGGKVRVVCDFLSPPLPSSKTRLVHKACSMRAMLILGVVPVPYGSRIRLRPYYHDPLSPSLLRRRDRCIRPAPCRPC